MIVLPLVVLALAGTAGVAQATRNRKLSDPRVQAERQVIYETALNTCKDPAKLRALSEVFRSQGLIAEADMLEKRAALQELPEETKEARREAFRKGMTCTDPVKVHALADAFYAQGATGASAELRKYAAGLTTAEEKTNEQA